MVKAKQGLEVLDGVIAAFETCDWEADVLNETVRAVGDGRQAGFFKRDRSTPFAQADDQWFTPLVTLLAFGAGGALLV